MTNVLPPLQKLGSDRIMCTPVVYFTVRCFRFLVRRDFILTSNFVPLVYVCLCVKVQNVDTRLFQFTFWLLVLVEKGNSLELPLFFQTASAALSLL